jgi:hypothetical protein
MGTVVVRCVEFVSAPPLIRNPRRAFILCWMVCRSNVQVLVQCMTENEDPVYDCWIGSEYLIVHCQRGSGIFHSFQ